MDYTHRARPIVREFFELNELYDHAPMLAGNSTIVGLIGLEGETAIESDGTGGLNAVLH